MTLRSNTLLVALLAGSLIGVVACGDDDDATSSSSSSSSTSGSANGGSGGMGTGGDASGGGGEGGGGVDCVQACTDLFQCGLEDDGNGMQLCPGFDGGGGAGGAAGISQDDFLNGSNMDGCVAACGDLPALAALIDPNNCAMTVMTISGADPGFAGACSGM